MFRNLSEYSDAQIFPVVKKHFENIDPSVTHCQLEELQDLILTYNS